jgi:hypothetical protein
MGRRRDDDLRPGLRSLAADDYVIIHSIVENDVNSARRARQP